MAESKPVDTCKECGGMGTKPTHRVDCPDKGK